MESKASVQCLSPMEAHQSAIPAKALQHVDDSTEVRSSHRPPMADHPVRSIDFDESLAYSEGPHVHLDKGKWKQPAETTGNTTTMNLPVAPSEIPQQSHLPPNQEQSAPNPFEHPQKIPGISPTVWVFPHSSGQISSEFHRRCGVVVAFFKQNTDNDAHLRDAPIGYELRLCGASPEDAHPAILVFCRAKDRKALKTLLTEPRLKQQYAQKKTSPLRTWLRRASVYEDEGDIPRFNMFVVSGKSPRSFLEPLWGQRVPVRLESSGTSPETARPESESLSMCGRTVSWLDSDGNTSTLSCVLQVGDGFYGLTAAHAALTQDGLPVKHAQQFDSQTESTNAPSDDVDDTEFGDYVIDDFTYDSLGENESSDAEDDEFQDDARCTLTAGNDHEPNPIPSSTSTMPNLSEAREVCFPTRSELLERKQINLDWALIRLDGAQRWRPNAFSNPTNSAQETILLSDVSPSLPKEETLVYIIVSPGKTVTGLLQPSVSYVDDMGEGTMSQYWTVIPMDDKGMSISTILKSCHGNEIHPSIVSWKLGIARC